MGDKHMLSGKEKVSFLVHCTKCEILPVCTRKTIYFDFAMILR